MQNATKVNYDSEGFNLIFDIHITKHNITVAQSL